MKICQVGVISFPSPDGSFEENAIGGIAGYSSELNDYIVRKGHKITYIGKIYHYRKTNSIDYFEIQDKITSTNKFLLHLFFKSFKIKLHVNEIIHAHRPDHLAAFSWFRRNPKIITIHGQQAVTVSSRKGMLVRNLYKFLERIAFRTAKHILVTDNITYNYYYKTYPKQKEKLSIIPTGVNIDKFYVLNKNILRRKFNISEKAKVIIYIGRVEYPKRIADIVKSFNILRSIINNVKLLIVGTGTDIGGIKNLINDLRIENDVYLLGMKMREELNEIINCADISVLYSYNEGSPLSIKESLACGVPVVANNVGDVEKTVIDGKTGYILKKESNEDLAKMMAKCINECENMKHSCLEKAKEFSTEKVLKRVYNIYESIWNESRD